MKHRTKKIIIICVLVLLAIVCIAFHVVHISHERKAQQYLLYLFEVQDFKEHKGDFQKAVDYGFDHFNAEFENDPDLSYVYIQSYGSQIHIAYNYDSGKGPKDEFEEPTEDVVSFFETIRKAIPANLLYYLSGCNTMYVYKNSVHFVLGPYALVYSTDGRPTFVIPETEGKYQYMVERVARNWYQIIAKEEE